ncbi:beta-propeller fold lactonase family protein [Anaerocolumna sp. AGMB13025]|uniref:lactonase family protein n=1 Tax=Anaerocolumna sp. AGMB13025 TaxID=3039116 RepID=UPI00241CFC9B|nr:beta-propeller fold lactonase family protein [Anaerocolumna sp. AGMB13025]WFR59261.1 beta-propeller fold lactonase family protein [Anaerocolumna sp. AGMB13025]
MPRYRTVNPYGMVYIMTNSSAGNQIAAFKSYTDGSLTLLDLYDTYGNGTGTKEVSAATPNDGIDTLASQGSIAISRDRRFLFNVNAGSNSISSFRIAGSGRLSFVSVVPSGGLQPNSLDVYDNLLYVSNVGDTENNFNSNITGFYVDAEGFLSVIPDSSRSLSTQNAQPARVLFSPNKHHLIVSELTTNRLSVFEVYQDGTLAGPVINHSNGEGPFGSIFTPQGALLIAEAGSNALSSYTLFRNGELEVISGSAGNGQQATCWVVTTPNGFFAYTSNAGNGTISIYRVNQYGSLTIVESLYSTQDALGVPIDSGVSRDGRYFYVLNGNQGSISVFRIAANGYLHYLQKIKCDEIPELGTQGLVVY